jgi:ATP-binding cassette subfamily B protein
MSDIDSFTWPASRLAEALEILARRAGFEFSLPTDTMPILKESDEAEVNRWLEAASARLGLEVEAVTASYNEVAEMIRKAGPALLQLPGAGADFLLLLTGGLRHVVLIKPDLSQHRVAIDRVVTVLIQELEAPAAERIDALLEAAQVEPLRRLRARKAILREQLSSAQIGGCWLLRLSPAGSFRQQLEHSRIPAKMLLLLGSHALQQGLLILGWWIIVQGVMQGHFSSVWIWAWGLVLLTSIPFQLLVIWLQSMLSVGIGVLFKQRMLFGTLQLYPEEVKHQGIGQFLGRVLEAETLETMMLGGGFAALIATEELFAATVILGMGAGGWLHALLRIVWLLVT